METAEKQRENFAAIRRKVIEPADKELCEKGRLAYSVAPHQGRSKGCLAAL